MSRYNTIRKFLIKVKESQCFSKSVVLKELLSYLVEQSIHGESPKEIEIAYEVFGKSKNQEKEKNIRIYVHNLRKKLTEYYEKEGQGDELIFSIPKGGYDVEITTNRKIIYQSKIAKIAPYALGASILLFIFSISFFPGNRRPEISKNFIWNEIYKSKNKLLIVLGDHYFVNQRNVFGNMSSTRFTEINSDNDFDEMLERSPEVANDLRKTEQTYINKQAPFGMHHILSFLGGGHIETEMLYSSELTWEHLKNSNTLFIGSYKTQSILKDIFEEIGIKFVFGNSTVEYSVNDSTIVYNPHSEEFLNKEFASLIHFKTSDGRTVMALMCNTDMGNIATVKHLTNTENLKQLEKLTANFPSDNFKAIFEVRGKELTDFEIYIKRIDYINIDINTLWP